MIGLGVGKDRLVATNTSSFGSGLDALLPEAEIRTIAPASHFAALGPCKPAGAAVLAEEADDPVCTDAPGSDRNTVLTDIIDAVAAHFELD
ncbi:MAG: hypothetical protein AB8B62_04405 [Roseobacter sp.]